MEWIYGLSHIVERRSSEENTNDSAQAGGSKKPQEKSIQDHGHISLISTFNPNQDKIPVTSDPHFRNPQANSPPTRHHTSQKIGKQPRQPFSAFRCKNKNVTRWRQSPAQMLLGVRAVSMQKTTLSAPLSLALQPFEFLVSQENFQKL